MLNPFSLEKICRERGIRSISQLSRKAGVHRNTVSAYMSGSLSPLTSSFQKICSALQIDALELIKEHSADNQNDLIARALKLLEPLISNNPNLAFLLIGSRAAGKHRPFSDIDLGLSAGAIGLDTDAYLKLRHQIEDKFDDFPVSIDIVNLDQAPAWFYAEMRIAPKYLAGNVESFNYIMGMISGYKKSQEDISR